MAADESAAAGDEDLGRHVGRLLPSNAAPSTDSKRVGDRVGVESRLSVGTARGCVLESAFLVVAQRTRRLDEGGAIRRVRDDAGGGAVGDQACRSVLGWNSSQDRTGGAEIAECLGWDTECTSLCGEQRDEDVARSEDIRQSLERLERQQQQVRSWSPLELGGEPVRTRALGDDDHDHRRVTGEAVSERDEQLRRVLPTERPAVEEDEIVDEPVFLGPRVLPCRHGKRVDRRPVLDQIDPLR